MGFEKYNHLDKEKKAIKSKNTEIADILLKKQNNFIFSINTQKKKTSYVDASIDFGGTGEYLDPSEMLLSSICSCISIEIVGFMKKNFRKVFKKLEISAKGYINKKVQPRSLSIIHLNIEAKTKANSKDVEDVIQQAINHCPILGMFPSCNVSFKFKKI